MLCTIQCAFGIEYTNQTLYEEGIIEPIESSLWQSPIVVKRKSNGEIRLCVDLRSLNKVIWVDGHPPPRINNLISLLHGATVFSKLDMRSAYHQVVLDASSRHLTAFVTPDGVFQYCRMSFGLASAAAVFQRVIEEVLHGLEGISVYQDDVLVFGESSAEHNNRLRLVLSAMERRGIRLRKDKCVFGVNVVEYLGHLISKDGIAPRPGLLSAISNVATPNDRDKLRAFMGMCEFYSKFVNGFATIAEPLLRLLKKNTKFVWNEEQERAFNNIKRELGRAPLLSPYVPGTEITITVDASNVGVGVVLTQNQRGCEKNDCICIPYPATTGKIIFCH